MSQFDVEKARRETQGCQEVLHFNNAGASLIPNPVYDAVAKYLLLESKIGGYETEEYQADALSSLYTNVAKLIHAEPQEIAFLENATRAWEMVFYSLKFERGDKIITSRAEYASNYIAFLQIAAQTGAVIEVIPDDNTGQISIAELSSRIDSRTKLIAITHVPTQGGLVNPAEEVGKIAHEAEVFYLLDATQSIGQMPIDVKQIGCDALCATGRKFLRGPRGTGFLYVSQRVVQQLEPPFLDLHAAKWTAMNAYKIEPGARRFETWEQNCAGKVGLAKAVEYALGWGMDNIWSRIQLLAANLRKQLDAIPGVSIKDLGSKKCGIVAFVSDRLPAPEIRKRLLEHKINVSVSVEEYARLDLEKRGLSSLVRSSVHYYNTQEEIDRFCNTVEHLVTGI